MKGFLTIYFVRQIYRSPKIDWAEKTVKNQTDPPPPTEGFEK